MSLDVVNGVARNSSRRYCSDNPSEGYAHLILAKDEESEGWILSMTLKDAKAQVPALVLLRIGPYRPLIGPIGFPPPIFARFPFRPVAAPHPLHLLRPFKPQINKYRASRAAFRISFIPTQSNRQRKNEPRRRRRPVLVDPNRRIQAGLGSGQGKASPDGPGEEEQPYRFGAETPRRHSRRVRSPHGIGPWPGGTRPQRKHRSAEDRRFHSRAA